MEEPPPELLFVLPLYLVRPKNEQPLIKTGDKNIIIAKNKAKKLFLLTFFCIQHPHYTNSIPHFKKKTIKYNKKSGIAPLLI